MKLTNLKEHIQRDAENIKTMKKRTKAFEMVSPKNEQMTKRLREQLKNSEEQIMENAKRYHSLVTSHKFELENLNKEINQINEKLKD